MNFRSKISRDNPYGITDENFTFSEKLIRFPPNLNKKRIEWLGYTINDLSKYKLIEIDKVHPDYKKGLRYRIEFENNLVANLEPNIINLWLLKWTHKKNWLSKNRNWLIQVIIGTLIGAMVSYFFSYRIGYQNGFKDGERKIVSDK